MTDTGLLTAVSLGTVHRTRPGCWFQDRIELPVRDGQRLDQLAADGRVDLFDTGAGYQYASIAG